MEQELLNGILVGLIVGFIYMYVRNKSNTIIEKTTKVSAFPIVFTEIYEGVILTYDNKTNDFVCQGNTLQEVAENLIHSKINEAFLIHDKNGSKKVYFVKNGTLKQLPT